MGLLLQMLLGPFVDVEQPLIAGGMINVTFQALFQTQVRACATAAQPQAFRSMQRARVVTCPRMPLHGAPGQVLERLVAWQAALALPCQVVLMPAVWDAFHHPTFPTPAFNLPADQVRTRRQHLHAMRRPVLCRPRPCHHSITRHQPPCTPAAAAAAAARATARSTW